MSFERSYDHRSKTLHTLKTDPSLTREAELPDSLPLKDLTTSVSESAELPETESEQPASPSRFERFRQLSSRWSDYIVPDTTNRDEGDLSTYYRENRKIKSSLILESFQHGIRTSLQDSSKSTDRDLLMTDFISNEVYYLSNNSYSFEFHAYAPVAFQFFRELFGITTEDFVRSICQEPLHLVNAGGNSGSDVYATNDDRFILKTAQKIEADFLVSLFPGYFLNITQHPKTLITKYFGLFCYQRGNKKIRVLVMNNLLPTQIKFHEKYDLKGATNSNRKTNSCQEVTGTSSISSDQDVLKDLDFLSRWPDGFYLSQKMYTLLMKAIEKDCTVLKSYEIMDYSLLLGIHMLEEDIQLLQVTSCSLEDIKSSPTTSNPSPLISRRKLDNLIGPFEARTMKGEKVHLYVGIIDILQSYTIKKKLEYYLKSLVFSSGTVSVNRPSFYSERFQSFLKNSVFKPIPELNVNTITGSPRRQIKNGNKASEKI